MPPIRIKTQEVEIEIDENFVDRVAVSTQSDPVFGPITKIEIGVVSNTALEAAARRNWIAAASYAVLSLIFLTIGIVVAWWIFGRTAALGALFSYAYYMAVVILGVSVAIVLFGVMRSYAHLSGTQGNFKFEVGGAAAAASIVVIGAFVLAKPPTTFDLAVRLQSAATDAAAFSGLVLRIDLGFRQDDKVFDATGQAIVPEVPTSLIGSKVHLALIGKRVILAASTDLVEIPSSHVIYLPVKMAP